MRKKPKLNKNNSGGGMGMYVENKAPMNKPKGKKKPK